MCNFLRHSITSVFKSLCRKCAFWKGSWSRWEERLKDLSSCYSAPIWPWNVCYHWLVRKEEESVKRMAICFGLAWAVDVLQALRNFGRNFKTIVWGRMISTTLLCSFEMNFVHFQDGRANFEKFPLKFSFHQPLKIFRLLCSLVSFSCRVSQFLKGNSESTRLQKAASQNISLTFSTYYSCRLSVFFHHLRSHYCPERLLMIHLTFHRSVDPFIP